MTEKSYPQVKWDDYYEGYRSTQLDPAYKVVPLDAIVIELGDLPEVASAGSYLTVDGVVYGTFKDAAEAELISRRWLALTEYLRANPPVDEAQVDAVTTALYEATQDPNDVDVPDVARRLVASGVRMETKK